MKSNISPPLLLERILRRLVSLAVAYKIPLIGSMTTGLLAYCFAFTNKLVNHDEVGMLFSKGVTISSGRWGLSALKFVLPDISMPWIYGILSLVLFSVSICLILSLFSIRNRLLQVLLSGTVMVFPSLIGLFGYMFTSSAYAVSFFLTVLAVWLVQRRNWFPTLLALGCLAFAVSIYQGYISVAASLMVVLMIQMLLQGEKVLTVILRGLQYVCFLLIAILGYWIATKLLFALISGGFNGYAEERFSEASPSVLARVALAYKTFFQVLLHGQYSIVPTAFSRAVHIVLLVCSAGLLLSWLLDGSDKKPMQVLAILLLLCLLPLAINGLLLVIGANGMHTLMQYGFVSVYVLAAVLADGFAAKLSGRPLGLVLGKLSANVSTLCLCAILVANTYIANASYLNLYLQYENTYSFMSTILSDLTRRPDFTQDTRLAIIGPWKRPGFYSEHLGFASNLTSVSGFSYDDLYSWPWFLEYYMGITIESANEEEIAAIRQTQAYADMQTYPYSGSMEMFGDILVIKLS